MERLAAFSAGVMFWEIIAECTNIPSRLNFVADFSPQGPVVASVPVLRTPVYSSENKVSAANTDGFYFRKTIHECLLRKGFP